MYMIFIRTKEGGVTQLVCSDRDLDNIISILNSSSDVIQYKMFINGGIIAKDSQYAVVEDDKFCDEFDWSK